MRGPRGELPLGLSLRHSTPHSRSAPPNCTILTIGLGWLLISLVSSVCLRRRLWQAGRGAFFLSLLLAWMDWAGFLQDVTVTVLGAIKRAIAPWYQTGKATNGAQQGFTLTGWNATKRASFFFLITTTRLQRATAAAAAA